jgi:Yip1 domain
MRPVFDGELKYSPWLPVWFRPGDTIERILAAKPRGSVLLLAGLGAAASLVAGIIDFGMGDALLGWRMLAAIVLLGAAEGIVFLYLNALFFRWSGRLLGGHASQAQLRMVLGWGMMPNVIGLAMCLAALVGLKLYSIPGSSQPIYDAVFIGLRGITAVLGLLGDRDNRPDAQARTRLRHGACDRQRHDRLDFGRVLNCRANQNTLVSTLQHTERRHDADHMGRRLYFRIEIRLRL